VTKTDRNMNNSTAFVAHISHTRNVPRIRKTENVKFRIEITNPFRTSGKAAESSEKTNVTMFKKINEVILRSYNSYVVSLYEEH